jgi:multisubunit Na+/H+ antiporter MnhF subunit
VAAVITVAIAALVLTAVLCAWRIARGPTIADRAIALDVLLLVALSIVALASARTLETAYIDLLVIAAVVSFVATVSIARYVDARGDADGA